ncbi:bifunctional metallophosphatase/5'-nucleotidase [Aliidiomarina halalkaliphila]|uniref:Bifunctional metallophosphatase/5'-nucleotidase n=1 Tax=Aliidiomarina halalkaliphila TaxID=2593535 RepID=A0A552X0K9_9GAMM|nr:bifunctional metallophosphatase/5'-nucleotidase [Aliidiomarina halalkaliphila]TRW48419.1 bifunctional metallophosphatase/5'-nucleotidase [Aliidiomarina halalkaliphila]
MKHWKSMVMSGLTLAILGCAPAPDPEIAPDYFELTIAHINDTHSAFDPVRGSFWMQDQRIFNEFGGHPRLLERVEQYRSEAQANNASMLFLHGGDAWQGSAYFKLNEGRMNADILSRMGIDAMALGNHEFDLDNRLLNEFLTTINFPVLAANIDTSADADLKDQTNLKPYVVFAFDGYEKERLSEVPIYPDGRPWVAVFGIALDDMPNIAPNTGDVEFFDMVESAQATVDELKALGVQKIIAVTHVGNAVDVDIASKVNGIDAIVGGHSHTLLGDFSNLNLGNNGEYAQRVPHPDGNGWTCVVQAGEYAQAIGRVRLEFDTEGNIRACEGGNTLLSNDTFYESNQRTASDRFDAMTHVRITDFIEHEDNIAIVPEHAALRAHIDTTYKPEMEAAYGDVIGMSPRGVRHVRRPGDDGSDAHGSEFAPLVALGQYWWAAQEEVVALTGIQPDFALVGAGGVRGSLGEGEVREGNLTLELLPFSNYLAIVPLTGAEVVRLLTDTINETLPEGSHAGKFPYGGNLRFEFTELEPGVRGAITLVEVNRGSIESPEWEPLDRDATYHVVMNAYNATGNDGWRVLYTSQRTQSERIDLAYVDGELRMFPVDRIDESGGRLQVIYEDTALSCSADRVVCNTDAMAVVEFIRHAWDDVRPLPYPVVTLHRASD